MYVVALEQEALPIIEYYKLKAIKGKLKVFKNLGNNIWLIISGIGSRKSSSAVKYLYKISKSKKDMIWINIGIAGHRNYEPGSILDIKKVTNNKGEVYYTSSILNNIKTNISLCVDTPEIRYKGDYVYDMESYGFIKSADKVTIKEFIFIFKIISDNLKYKPISYKKFAYKNIKDNIKRIDEILSQNILYLSKSFVSTESVMKLITKKFHVTFYNKKKLANILSRILLLNNIEEIKKEIRNQNNINDLLNSFETKLKNFIVEL